MTKVESIARQVWQEFSPRDGDVLAFREDGIILVTAGDGAEGFDIDPDDPVGVMAAYLADRIQTIMMEGRHQMVPDCPLHPAAHPLHSGVVNHRAAWVCPWTESLVRYIEVTAEPA